MIKSNSHIWEWQNLKVAWQVEGENIDSNCSTLLIHGFGASKEHWRHNQKCYGSVNPCYAIDLIGFGESSQPNANLTRNINTENNFIYCFDSWSKQIVDFCTEIIKTPVLIVGNSIGGVIALKASKLLDKQCLGVVLIDCAQRTMDEKRLKEQSIGTRLLRPLIKNLVRQKWLSLNIFNAVARPFFIKKILEIAYPTKNNVDKSLIKILYEPTTRIGAPEAFRGFINLFNDYLAPELMKDLNIKVYLIWGEKDPWESLDEAKEWQKSFPCIHSLDIIKDCGHCPHDENPERVNQIILKKIQASM
tara:strand:+ start:18126 stop:19037 length:912 start_codon:yes stop_codon:yes gene_type:complete